MNRPMPKFMRENIEFFDGQRLVAKENAPIELKKKFEDWYNRSDFCFETDGFQDPWYTWDGKTIEKKDRFKRPGFGK